jgi:hypothetical protein
LGVSGTDTGSCTTASHPCRTFHYVDSHAGAGDIVHVLPGTYYLSGSTCIVTNTAHVTWQSDVHGAATICWLSRYRNSITTSAMISKSNFPRALEIWSLCRK